MIWLRDHGLVSSYHDYEALPVNVLEDARMVMEVEAAHRAEQERREAAHGLRR